MFQFKCFKIWYLIFIYSLDVSQTTWLCSNYILIQYDLYIYNLYDAELDSFTC